MKILIAADLHWPTINGVATFSRNLAKGLASRGHEVLVIAPSQTGKKYQETDENHTVMRTAALPFPFYQNFRISLMPQGEVKTIMEEFQPDIVHIQSMLGNGRAALACAKKIGIPVVATNHAMPENLLDNLYLLAPFARPIGFMMKEYGARFHNNADYVTLPTKAAINMFGDSAEEIKVPIKAISNGIDLSRFKPGAFPKEIREKYKLPARKPIITYLGRLDSEKHVKVLVYAFQRVLKKLDVHLLIVGGGNDFENLKELVEKLGLKGRVTLTGRVPEEDLAPLHRAGKVFVMPSPVELQCISMLEAMASGLPVIAVKDGALRELCKNGKNGYLVKTDDDAAIARKLIALLTDEPLRKKMGKESVKVAKTHDLNYTLDQFEEVYRAVLDKK